MCKVLVVTTLVEASGRGSWANQMSDYKINMQVLFNVSLAVLTAGATISRWGC